MKSKVKVLLLTLCAVLLVAGTVLGTHAYLTDSLTKDMDLMTALHYLEGDRHSRITAEVSRITFGLNADYADIVAAYDGTPVEAEQDIPVYAYYVPNESGYDVYMLADGKIYAPENSSNLFANMTQLTFFDGTNLGTGRTKDMSFMFFGCTKLPDLDVTGWDTANVTTTMNMFGGNRLLTAITGLDTWDVSNVTDTANMFIDCFSLQKLDNIGTWNTGKVTAMECMFYNCVDLTEVDVSDWDVSSVWNMWGMFRGCKSLTRIDMNRWNTGKVTDMAEMFDGCCSLKTITIPDGITSIGNDAFYGCSSLTAVTIPEGVKTIGERAFADCGGVTAVTFLGDAPTFDSDCFDGVTAKAFYLNVYETWTEDIKQSYGGSMTWKSHVIGEFIYNGDATCTEDGTQTGVCSECGEAFVKAAPGTATNHTFDGNETCTVCGAANPDYVPSVIRPTLTLKAPTLEFKDVIKVVVYFTAENIEDVAEMGMITYKERVTEWSVETADYVLNGAEYEEDLGCYCASSQGIPAKFLGDTMYLACYARLTDGSYVYTKLAPYSPITYATNQLKNSTDARLKQLVVSMLNYGAAAQSYFKYNMDSLANSTLTDEQNALPEAYRADMVSKVPAASVAKQGIFANNQGFSGRSPTVSFEGAFSINYLFTPAYTPVDGITLYHWNAADYEAASVLTTDNASGSIKMDGVGMEPYRGDIVGIAAKDLSKAVYVAAVYSDGTTTRTSGVLGYSIGAYCASQASKGGDIAELVMATAVYGYHAKQYFGS